MTDPVSTSQAPRLSLGDATAAYEAAVERARSEDWANRLFARDVTLWSTDPRVGEAIADRLGWLDAPAHFTERIAGPRGLRRRDRRGGLHDGRRRRDGRQQPRAGRPAPDLRHRRTATSPCGSSTRPIRRTWRRPWTTSTRCGRSSSSPPSRARRPSRTRSWPTPGTAPEARSTRVRHHVYENPGGFIAAITDPGKSVEAIAHHDEFREVFLNPPDIGGRYSALTYVGLVPGVADRARPRRAARLGASAMLGACREPDPAANPGVSLGLAIGTLATAGRDKLTFLADDAIAVVRRLGRAAHRREHRQARRRASCPVDLEPLGGVGRLRRRPGVRPASRLAGAATTAAATTLADALEAAGHPVIRIDARRPDRPRRRVRPLGGRHRDRRRRPGHRPVRPAERRGGQAADPRRAGAPRARRGRRRRAATAARRRRRPHPARRRGAPADRGRRRPSSPSCARHLARRRPNAYLALQAFIAPTPARDAAHRPDPRAPARPDRPRDDRRLRAALPALDRPAPQGRRADRLVPPADRRTIRTIAPIPGWPYTFGQLIDAQAAGDFAAIEAHDLPVLRVHLGADPGRRAGRPRAGARAPRSTSPTEA